MNQLTLDPGASHNHSFLPILFHDEPLIVKQANDMVQCPRGVYTGLAGHE